MKKINVRKLCEGVRSQMALLVDVGRCHRMSCRNILKILIKDIFWSIYEKKEVAIFVDADSFRDVFLNGSISDQEFYVGNIIETIKNS